MIGWYHKKCIIKNHDSSSWWHRMASALQPANRAEALHSWAPLAAPPQMAHLLQQSLSSHLCEMVPVGGGQRQ